MGFDEVEVLLVAPPRLMWPYINAYDNFMVPQNLPCLAAYLRQHKIKVKIIDCMPLKMGWRTLLKTIADLNPKIVAAGENHALFSTEVVKLFREVKKISKGIVTVAGGTHFSFLGEEYLISHPEIDFIVVGEGEETFLELCMTILNGGELSKVRGIIYRDENGKPTRTPPRPLIPNLDLLPMPAYDLLPMNRYGRSKFLFASHGSTIHHSRGCTSSCKFCGFWIQMAKVEYKNGNYELRPAWRTKSPERTLEEVKYLADKFDRKFLVWVDDTFNTNPKWNDEFAELVLKSGIKTNWYCFMRADYILRDEKLGIMEKLVRAGLIHISIGAERPYDEDLVELGKSFYTEEVLRECTKLIRRKYPKVFIQISFITGLMNDTKETFYDILKFAKELSPDYAAFHPLMPIPGTELWKEAKRKGYIKIHDFNLYDLVTPIMSTKYLTREEVDELTREITHKYVSLPWFIKGILGGSYRRRMYLWWLIVTLRITLISFLKLKLPFNEYQNLVYPQWYWN